MIVTERIRNPTKKGPGELTEQMKGLVKKAVRHMCGKERRAYMAEAALELLEGNARQAERVSGRGRGTVCKGRRERAVRGSSVKITMQGAAAERQKNACLGRKPISGRWQIRPARPIPDFRRRLRIPASPQKLSVEH